MKFTPLPNSILLVSLLVLIVVGFKLYYGSFDITWGFTLIVLSLIFITASFLSITPNESDFKEK